MIRAYALGQGTSTQALILLPWTAIVGDPGEHLTGDLLFISAWAINLAVAEWVIRCIPTRPGSQVAIATSGKGSKARQSRT